MSGSGATPRVGDTVLFVEPGVRRDTHPAVVTRVLEDGRLNLQVLFDGLPARARMEVAAEREGGGALQLAAGCWRARG